MTRVAEANGRRRSLILVAVVLAVGAASPQAFGDEPPSPPATTSAPEPVTVPSPQPAAEPAPKPDPAPPVGLLAPPKSETASPTPPPAPPPAPAPPVSPPPVQPVRAAVAPKPKHKRHKKKLHPKARPGRDRPRPAEERVGDGMTHSSSGGAPAVAGREPLAGGEAAIVVGLAEPLRDGGAGAVLSALLLAMLGLAIVLFALAAAPAAPLGDALVAALIVTRRVELAAGGALTLAAAATLLAVISLSS